MIRAVLFDLDNTLLDFISVKKKSVDAAILAMIEAGLMIDRQVARDSIFEIYNKKGYEYQEVFDDFLISKIGKLDYKILASAIVAYRKTKEASIMLYPNVGNTLIKLAKDGYKLAVLSDAPSREAWVRLYSVNLHHLFDVVVTYNDTNKLKPSPEPFNKAAELLKVSTEEIIMVGDWPDRDVVGAKSVGMKTAFAKYGDVFNTKKSGADYDLENISELLKIVEND
tara:strand:+ start:701 stop:1375 length:675 start_codon:yes stop_codon:yes gene_type:complete